MSSISYRHSIAIFCCALPIAATAQPAHSVPQLDNIVVTASRSPQLASEVIGDVTVIDKKELERAGQTSVAEILAKQPGVQFSSTGGPQTQTSVFLRGTNSTHTLVLIDGVRINSTIQGSINWNAIDPATIERIEIVRGAASSLYGSDAIGGVINIITNKSGSDRPLSAWANIGHGTHNTTKSSAGLSGAADGWDYSFSAATTSSDGFDATTPDQPQGSHHPDKDGYQQHSISGTLGYQLNADHALRFTLYNTYVDGDEDAGPSLPDATSTTRQQAYTIASTNKITTNWTSTAKFGISKEEYDIRAWNTLFSSLQRSFSWKNDFKLSDEQTLSVVLERLEERATHTESFAVDERNTNSIAGIYRGDFGRHHVQASLRNDTITGYKKRTTGGLGYEFDIDDAWTIGMNASTGFRLPTFSDLYWPADPVYGGGGNPSLKPERSRNVEAHISFVQDAASASMTLYQNKIRNLIALDSSFKPQNITEATIRGITLTGEYRLDNTTFSGSVDLMDPKNDMTGKTLQRRAKHVYNLGVSHQVHAWNFGAEYQFVGKRYDDPANSPNRRMGGYSLFNLTAAYDFSKNVGVQVRWNNIFDKDYTNAYGYNMPGSNIFVNLSFRM